MIESLNITSPTAVIAADPSFMLRVEGDSMTSPYPGEQSFPAGTIIVVDPTRAAHAGD